MARSQGNGGPIPPCPFLLRKTKFTHAKVAKIAKGGEGIRLSGVKGGPIPPCPFSFEDRGIYSRKGRDGGYFLFTFECVAAVA